MMTQGIDPNDIFHNGQWYNRTGAILAPAGTDVSQLHQVSTHCRYPDVLGGVKQWFSMSMHFAWDDIPLFRLGFGNYTGYQEIANSAPLNVMTALEYPLGVDKLQQITYAGSLTGNINAGGDMLCDPFRPTTYIRKFTWFKLWHWHSSSGGVPYALNGPQPWTNSNANAIDTYSGTPSTGINYLMQKATAAERNAIATIDPTSNLKLVPRCIISETAVRSLGFIGDSRASGQGSSSPYAFDYVSDASLNAGALERIYGPLGPWLNLAATQDSAQSFLGGNGGRRQAYLAFVTDVVNGMGTNDTNLSGSTLTGQDAQIYNLTNIRGKKAYRFTVPPKTTSTDQFTTLANQTVSGNEANRLALNSFRLANTDGLYANVLDFNAIVADIATGKWKIGANARSMTAAMTVGSNVVTAATGTFTAADAGKRIFITGAAGSSGNLIGVMQFTDATHANVINAVTGAAINCGTAVTTATTYVNCNEFSSDGTHETQFAGQQYQANLVAALA